MSDYVKSYLSQDGDGQLSSPNIVQMRDEYPNLTQALIGARGPDNKLVIWPATLMLFLEGDQLKWCLSPKVGDKVAFGTVLDPSKGLTDVESALKLGKFEWKKRKASR